MPLVPYDLEASRQPLGQDCAAVNAAWQKMGKGTTIWYSCCDIPGITCSDATSGRITNLYVMPLLSYFSNICSRQRKRRWESQSLKGLIPSEIGNLTALILL
jgi:hypothetical protein